MVNRGTFRSLACVGLGAVLGLIAASADFNLFQRADAAPTPPATARTLAASTTVAPCCTDELTKGTLLAQAETKKSAAGGAQKKSPSPQGAGKKPNILVIWGDDVGWWNVSAYNQGMMGYKTPNIDRIAREGFSPAVSTRPAATESRSLPPCRRQ